ncbi:helix-turn-helix transcriptional regulator [Halobacillus sp. A5]|uniref:ArsR/SmtB family transcription factor n=1 Tax=Halobacillus sp. A5 TaxID=2880263 RepID=UPI0020A6A0A0|nr:metalloregulator ArsR/SmtB family transcription factor [Halobacillus sp. A5]MCP3026959.1 ArsR family transcriptional regulator [Halobacillus sp. A5]
MEVIQSSFKKRETYHVQLKHSVLFECALGIAAVTNKPLLDTLEKKTWGIDHFNEDLTNELAFVEKNNTWKALLQLLHQDSFSSLQAFTSFITSLDDQRLKYVCLPYVGEALEKLRTEASKGSKDAVEALVHRVKDHSFFPAYIAFIAEVDAGTLRTHLQQVMKVWYATVIQPEEKELIELLKRDYEAKEKMKEKLEAEAFVEWATGGINYRPEPSVYQVLLVPHYTYRPWNVEADLKGTKVFYYPVSNASLYRDDAYIPEQNLVQQYKALGDEVRLKLVKYLFESERSLQELTSLLQMRKSTLHHHLKMLKAARIVDSSQSMYRLNKYKLDAMPIDLAQFLGKKNE